MILFQGNLKWEECNPVRSRKMFQAAQQYGASPTDNTTASYIRLNEKVEIAEKYEEEKYGVSAVS